MTRHRQSRRPGQPAVSAAVFLTMTAFTVHATEWAQSTASLWWSEVMFGSVVLEALAAGWFVRASAIGLARQVRSLRAGPGRPAAGSGTRRVPPTRDQAFANEWRAHEPQVRAVDPEAVCAAQAEIYARRHADWAALLSGEAMDLTGGRRHS